jgi:hypothetical protein
LIPTIHSECAAIAELPELLLAKKIAAERITLDRYFCDDSYAQRLSSATVTAREAEWLPGV